MSNTITRWNICFAILAFFLSIAAFTGCGKNEKTGNECGKTEVFADDLQKGNAAYDEGDYDAATYDMVFDGRRRGVRRRGFCPAAHRNYVETNCKKVAGCCRGLRIACRL